ncbi:ATP-dependent helicase [Zongyangia hominis]|uniref:ATP-dependent DNA helicase PcrA n=1 Tax=Zongyangia hominis TaxID=2763677 RepID=A0A926EDF7_9FIRM|nr:UvrD-helicase domain-containing protein [Zongyangia hominis]MBC8569891.1 UvrD-helicase domain-containing protein [Zongyangia hominis]
MNDRQKKAVFQIGGPVLILAGAGSGKTTVLVNRIANMVRFGDAYSAPNLEEYTQEQRSFLQDLIDGRTEDLNALAEIVAHYPVKPWNILAITFTNKAAGELKARLSSMLGEDAQDIAAGTFHSACVRILRREIDRLGYKSSFTIYDTDDSVRVIKDSLKELNINDKNFAPKRILGQISRSKDTMVTPAEFTKQAGSDYRLSTIAKVYELYQKKLKAANAVDFDDIICLTVRLFEENEDVLEHYQNRYKYILVDEYQDTNHAQYRLVSLLSQKRQNICVVGDDDQSIYKFRGADIENILSFEQQFPGALVIRLEQNYRSTQNILDAANEVIENNVSRKGKTLWTDSGAGEKIAVHRFYSEAEEAQFIADTIVSDVANGQKYADHAVLYRMNAQSNSVEKTLVKSAIPYRIIGGLRFYERKEVKDMVAYLSVINNPADAVRLNRIINEPKRGIGAATVAAAQQIAAQTGENLFDVFAAADEYAALSRKAGGLKAFAAMIGELSDTAMTGELCELFDEVLEKTGYRIMLEAQGDEGRTRLENVEELRSNIVKYCQENEEPTLSGFLEEISLYTDLDNFDPDEDSVILMTMHSAKGLEFENVFLIGMEEGIFPGMQSIYNPGEIEEERRLAYVGITRAKRRLYLTSASQRMIFGSTARNRPSRFITEIPKNLCDFEDKTVITRPAVEARSFVKPGVREGVRSSIGIGSAPKPAQKGETGFLPGDQVLHKVFGAGVILSATPMGGDRLLEIAFDKVGTKKIMENFARLQRG